jgi:CheY-like chemotaxis protein
MTTVLVVDGSLIERESLAAMLEAAGYRVPTAESATSALRVILRSPPDVVVLDLLLPDFHGTETARAIHSVAGLTGLPIVAVAHHARTVRDLAPASFGAECLLIKPVRRHELLDAVARCLRLRAAS